MLAVLFVLAMVWTLITENPFLGGAGTSAISSTLLVAGVIFDLVKDNQRELASCIKK
jgi:hypothetical protein